MCRHALRTGHALNLGRVGADTLLSNCTARPPDRDMLVPASKSVWNISVLLLWPLQQLTSVSAAARPIREQN